MTRASERSATSLGIPPPCISRSQIGLKPEANIRFKVFEVVRNLQKLSAPRWEEIMKRFLILAIGLSAFGLSLSSAYADCLVGDHKCVGGTSWVCTTCGSQTCWIITGNCHKDDLPDQHVDNASRFDVAQTRSARTASDLLSATTFPPGDAAKLK
jgi:hypothetical protein